jgi:hypothetical protein
LQAAVLTDVQSPATTYLNVNCACDFDTAQTYALSPARAFWILSKAGFAGDIDFYSGVFFALKRVRSGGSFHQATVTISAGSSGFNLGSLFGDGDAMFLQVGGNSYGDGLGTAFGAAVYPTDTVDTLAQRFVNAINTLFVGISAAKTGTGQLTITTLSPVAGFTLFTSYAAGTGANGANPSTGSIAVGGDIKAGNEGVWQVDASQSQPLNRAFTDYLADFRAQVQAAGQTMTVAFSQELLAPPDVNTPRGRVGATVRQRQPGSHGHWIRKLGSRFRRGGQRLQPDHDPANRPRLHHWEHGSHFKLNASRRLGDQRNRRKSLPAHHADLGRLHARCRRRDLHRSSDHTMHVQSVDRDAVPGSVLHTGGRNHEHRRFDTVAPVRRVPLVVLQRGPEPRCGLRELDVPDFHWHGQPARLLYGPACDPRRHPRQHGGERGPDDHRHRRDALHPQRFERERQLRGRHRNMQRRRHGLL